MRKMRNKAAVLLTVMMLTITMFAMGAGASTVSKVKKACAKDIIAAQIEDTDTNVEKLEKLFTHMESSYGYASMMTSKYFGKITVPNTRTQLTKLAQEIQQKKNGSCYHFAALYAYMAKTATKLPVRVALGETKGFTGKPQKHAWTEIKIGKAWYIFDVNLNQMKKKGTLTYFKKKNTSKAMKKLYCIKDCKPRYVTMK